MKIMKKICINFKCNEKRGKACMVKMQGQWSAMPAKFNKVMAEDEYFSIMDECNT